MTTVQRDCPHRPDPRGDRHKRIRDLLYRVRDASGGIKGLAHRYAEQIASDASVGGGKIELLYRNLSRCFESANAGGL